MTRIDGFNPNLPQISSKSVQVNKNVDEQQQAETVNTNFKSGDENLNFMANTAYMPLETPKQQSEVSSKTVIPVSQYVTPEQGQRITESLQQFDNLYSSISSVAQKELSIPKELADKVALETIESKYMPA